MDQGALGTERPQRGRQNHVQGRADRLLAFLVENAEEDHAKADERHHEGKRQYILKYVEGEIAKIARNADRPKDGVDAPIEEDRKTDQQHIEKTVDGLADFHRFGAGADRAPEGERAEKVQPEAEIAGFGS